MSIVSTNLESNVLGGWRDRYVVRVVGLAAGLALGVGLALGGASHSEVRAGLLSSVAYAEEAGIGLETMSESFEPRTEAPEERNLWYYSDVNPYYAYPGLAPKGRQEDGSYVIGNCTWYAWGRIAEIIGRDPGIGAKDPEGMLSDAASLGYEIGSEPREGALAVGYANYGNSHVAVVEEMVDGVPYVSQSAYRTSYSWPGYDQVVFEYVSLDEAFGDNPVTYVYFGDFESSGSRSFDIEELPVGDGIMYRLYNPYTGEHLYTASSDETASLADVGWSYEGVGWTAPEMGAPVFRLYNPYAPGGDHHYTMSAEECASLESVGWVYEGVGWHSDHDEGVALYRQYNPNAGSGSHNYTTSKEENDMLVSMGWREEGIAWYGVA